MSTNFTLYKPDVHSHVYLILDQWDYIDVTTHGGTPFKVYGCIFASGTCPDDITVKCNAMSAKVTEKDKEILMKKVKESALFSYEINKKKNKKAP
ncbi:MAG: hypothetical protein J6B87_00075 [Clostridia bacterium]|nr:hypothetical protein [Clostridia bacterium]